eukprot:m.189426 g.189426  ORF g.189426 m.189426 type:complete len:687 (-) comp17725_c0_seq1:107-2167(-)
MPGSQPSEDIPLKSISPNALQVPNGADSHGDEEPSSPDGSPTLKPAGRTKSYHQAVVSPITLTPTHTASDIAEENEDEDGAVPSGTIQRESCISRFSVTAVDTIAAPAGAKAAAVAPEPRRKSDPQDRSSSAIVGGSNYLLTVPRSANVRRSRSMEVYTDIRKTRSLQQVPRPGETLDADMRRMYAKALQNRLTEGEETLPTPVLWQKPEQYRATVDSSARIIPSKKTHSSKYPYFNINRKHQRLVFPTDAIIKGYWHTILHAGTGPLLLAITVCYMIIFLAFTPIYMAISEECGLQLGDESGNKFSDALYLSVETMTTIGYGVPDPYYNGCGYGFICVIGQSLLGFCMNAVLFGTVFARVSRAQRRAVSVKFTPKACIREIWGRFFLTFQVCEARRFHVVSSEVTAYVALQNQYSDVPYQLHAIRLIRPDDAIGSRLLLCLPSTVVHEIDAWSPLAPPSKVGDCAGFPETSSYSYKWPSTRQRYDDSLSNNRNAYFCVVCGDSYSSEAILRRHTSSNAANENRDCDGKTICLVCGDNVPWADLTQHYTDHHPDDHFEDLVYNEHWITGQTFNHANVFDNCGYRHDGVDNVGPRRFTREEIKDWMSRSCPELICILGAVDVATGSNFETQHSYTVDDIVWDAQHKPCVYPDEKTKVATVDFRAFLDVIDAPPVPIGGLVDDIQFHL